MILTLAITTYNRFDMLLESFANVIDDPRISEVLIMDDCSSPEYWNKIKDLGKFNPKIRVVRQAQNRGMSVNKRDAVYYSANDWVILFDSDNIIGKDYLDALYALPVLYTNTIYCPDFAKPEFNFKKHSGHYYSIDNVSKVIENSKEFNTMMNACNYVVNKDAYLRVWENNAAMKGTDTIYMNYLWLKSGNGFYVVPKMEYFHRVHKESGFLKDMVYNMNKAEEVKKLIQCL